MQIMVRDNNVDQALRALKKKLQREGVYSDVKYPTSATSASAICFAEPLESPFSISHQGAA